MKSIFLLLLITSGVQLELLSKLKKSSNELLENVPEKLKTGELVHEKAYNFPQDRPTINDINEGTDNIPSESSELKLNSTFWLQFTPDLNKTYPENFDWREYGAVSSVKFQGHCASDWAFSAIGAVEGQHFRKTGQLKELSVQQVLDCSKHFDNDGCQGGLIHKTFEYIRSNGGIDTDTSYPYDGTDGICRFKPETVGATVKGYVYVESGDEKALEAALATVGPIAVALAIKPTEMFNKYKDGVYYDPQCGNRAEDLTFGALLVGYGKEANGEKYWLVKGSYGTSWGIEGYMKIAKDVNNHCGIATYASFPLV